MDDLQQKMTVPKLTKEQAAEALESAAMVVCIPEWHTKGEFSRNNSGDGRPTNNPCAACFCAIGAILAAADALGVHNVAINSLRKEIAKKNHHSVADWNDDPLTTPLMVAEAMWEAAQELRAQA